MNILVVGGAGFIGSVLVRDLLTHGYSVRVLDSLLYGDKALQLYSENFELITGDCRDASTVTRAASGMDAVIHLAAIVGVPAGNVDEQLTLSTNYEGAVNTAKCAKAAGCPRFIYISTYAVCGRCDGYVDESTPLAPTSVYARAKGLAEAPILALNDANFRTTVMRLATNYGLSPRPRYDLVVNLLTSRAVQEHKFSIFGGDQWRSFMHVQDTSRAIITVLEADQTKTAGQIFCAGGDNYTLLDIGKAVLEVVHDATMDIGAPQDDVNLKVCYNKIGRLGFHPLHTLYEGIKEVADAVRTSRESCRSTHFSNVAMLKRPSDSIVVVMLTWCGPPERNLAKKRLEYLDRTLITLKEHLGYSHYTWHIADDHSEQWYVDEVLKRFKNEPYTFSDSGVGGDVGANINAGLQAAFGQADVALLWHDDRFLQYNWDLGPCYKLLTEDTSTCLVRIKPQRPGMKASSFSRYGKNWWRVDRTSYCSHVVDIGPHLLHRRFVDIYGLYNVGVNPGEADNLINAKFCTIDGPDIVVPDEFWHRTEIPWGGFSTWE